MPDFPSPPGAKTEWLAVIAAAAIAVPIWNFRGNASARGPEIEAALTLVTSDESELSCASGRAYSGYRCELRAPDVAWPEPPARAERLVPYRSENEQMFLLPALFDEPAVHARYERELPDRVSQGALRRFTAHCKLRLVEHVEEGFSVRWVRDGTWNSVTNAWVAVPVSCRVDG